MEIISLNSTDILEQIAKKRKMSIESILAENGIRSPNECGENDKICIPSPREMYYVQRGDTIEAIAKKRRIAKRQIYRNNLHLLRQPLRVGEPLVVPICTPRETLRIVGYADSHIPRSDVEASLPYLTIFVYTEGSYRQGDRIHIPRNPYQKMAKDLRVLPLWMPSTDSDTPLLSPHLAEGLLSHGYGGMVLPLAGYLPTVYQKAIEETVRIFHELGLVLFCHVREDSYDTYSAPLSEVTDGILSARTNIQTPWEVYLRYLTYDTPSMVRHACYPELPYAGAMVIGEASTYFPLKEAASVKKKHRAQRTKDSPIEWHTAEGTLYIEDAASISAALDRFSNAGYAGLCLHVGYVSRQLYTILNEKFRII